MTAICAVDSTLGGSGGTAGPWLRRGSPLVRELEVEGGLDVGEGLDDAGRIPLGPPIEHGRIEGPRAAKASSTASS